MTQYVANQRKGLVPLELLIHQVPPLSQQPERLMPIEISQAFGHGCAATALTSNNVVENLNSDDSVSPCQCTVVGTGSRLINSRLMPQL